MRYLDRTRRELSESVLKSRKIIFRKKDIGEKQNIPKIFWDFWYFLTINSPNKCFFGNIWMSIFWEKPSKKNPKIGKIMTKLFFRMIHQKWWIMAIKFLNFEKYLKMPIKIAIRLLFVFCCVIWIELDESFQNLC